MLTQKDRAATQKAFETARLLRVKNLRTLKDAAGGWAALARQCGKQESLLCRCAGPNPVRDIGERLARDIEFALKLPEKWLDQTHGEWQVKPSRSR
jgi:hypothetical protein